MKLNVHASQYDNLPCLLEKHKWSLLPQPIVLQCCCRPLPDCEAFQTSHTWLAIHLTTHQVCSASFSVSNVIETGICASLHFVHRCFPNVPSCPLHQNIGQLSRKLKLSMKQSKPKNLVYSPCICKWLYHHCTLHFPTTQNGVQSLS